MSKTKSRYEILNDEAVAALRRMDEACKRKDNPAVEFEDKEVQRLLGEMRAERLKQF